MGLPIMLATFDRHREVQYLKGKLGSFTQVGSFVISEAWKSNSCMIFKISGRLNTKYGPTLKVSNQKERHSKSGFVLPVFVNEGQQGCITMEFPCYIPN